MLTAALMIPAVLSTVAFANGTLPDGNYTLSLPGESDFTFEVKTNEFGTDVEAVATPDGYKIREAYMSKVAWSETGDDESQIKAKGSKIKADVDWSKGDTVVLSVEDGLSITVVRTAFEMYDLSVSSGWTALGPNGDWRVVSDEDPDMVFKVKADEEGIEIKAIDPEGDRSHKDDDKGDKGDDDEGKPGKGRP